MKKYYISEKLEGENFTALNKARNDVEKFLFEEYEYERLNFYAKIDKSKFPTLKSIGELAKLLIKIKSSDLIYFQYPFFERPNKMRVIMDILKRIKNPKLIAIIHDIDSLRWGKGDKKIREEVLHLSKFDYLISHNKSMTRWLRENGCKNTIIDLDIFDYLVNDEDEENGNIRKTDIVFAGNLSEKKSKFIYELINKDIDYKINLYGPNFNESIYKNNIKYCGIFNPNELMRNIEGKYGLIWDGDSLDSCSGYLGNYTKYNNPHKASMYIAAELPIICWSEMAIAEFVRQQNIGICIDKLDDIEKILKKISNEEYNIKVMNVVNIKKKIIRGYYTKKAIATVNELIESSY